MSSQHAGPTRRAFFGQCLAGLAAAPAATALGHAASPSNAFQPVRPPMDRKEEVTWSAVRAQFRLDRELAYFNTGGLGPTPNVVLNTVQAETLDLERVCETGRDRIAAVRQKACALLGCSEDELGITRNTTEGMNSIARGLPLQSGDEVLITTHEHPGGAEPWFALARDVGVSVMTFEPGDGGADTLARVEAALTPRTRAVMVSHVTCTTGLVLPVQDITKLCQAKGIVAVIDGAQAAGMIPVDVHRLGCDFYATSGHKWLLGPKGTGLLYVRDAMLDRWRPVFAGAHTDRKFDLDQGMFETVRAARAVEYGTRSTPVTMGLGAAIDFLAGLGMDRVAERGHQLASQLKNALSRLATVELLTPLARPHCASIVTFRLRNATRTPGQWCQRFKTDHRIRLRPVGEHGLNAIRACTHVFNSEAEVDRLIDVLATTTDG